MKKKTPFEVHVEDIEKTLGAPFQFSKEELVALRQCPEEGLLLILQTIRKAFIHGGIRGADRGFERAVAQMRAYTK